MLSFDCIKVISIWLIDLLHINSQAINFLNDKLTVNMFKMTGLKRVYFAVLMMGLIVFAGSNNSIAQDVEITDEELKTYAVGMNKIDSIKGAESEQYKNLIKSNEVLKGRYNKVKKAYGDEAKLAEIEATPEEIAAYEGLQQTYADMKKRLNEMVPEIIKSDIGAAVYNKVRKGLKTDADLKARYEEVKTSLTSDEDA